MFEKEKHQIFTYEQILVICFKPITQLLVVVPQFFLLVF